MRLFSTILALLSVLSLQGQDCYTDFNYTRSIDLTLTGGQTNFEAATVAIPFDSKSLYDAGKLAADGSDIRVTDGNCNELHFFIQGIPDHEQNVLYVKIPAFGISGLPLQLYYGSNVPQTSAINGNATFEFFDDFEDGLIDTDKWEAIGHYDLWAEADGQMKFTGSFGTGGIFKYVAPKVAYRETMTFDYATNASNSQVYGVCDTADIQRIGYRYTGGSISFDTMDIFALMFDTLNGGSSTGELYPYVQVPKQQIQIISTTTFVDADNHLNMIRFENLSNGSKNLDTMLVYQMEYEAMRPYFSSFTSPALIEYIGIRKAIPFDPNIVIGEEVELMSTGLEGLENAFGIQISPNPASDWIQIQHGATEPQAIQIWNVNGQLMWSGSFQPKVDVSGFEAGLYWLGIQTPRGQVVLKWLKL
jgi:hypothetical protein